METSIYQHFKFQKGGKGMIMVRNSTIQMIIVEFPLDK